MAGDQGGDSRKSRATEQPGGGEGSAKPGIQEWFLKTAGAIIGSLGLAGSMVVIGSAVLWVRFKEAGLPAVQAVSVQMRDEALVQGAQTTIAFVLAALAAVAALYVADCRGLDAEAQEREEKKGPASRALKPADGHRMRGPTLALVGLLPVLGILWAIVDTDLGSWAVARLALLAILLTGGCVWMARNDSKNFWALAAAVFVSVLVFAGVAGYLIVKEQRFIQGVAVLRGADDPGLTGFYVTDDGEKLYIATPVGAQGGRPGDAAIRRFGLGKSLAYSVGPLESIPAAERTARAMLADLIDDRRSLRAGKPALPRWIPKEKAATFTGEIEARVKAPPRGLCLMRYAEVAQTQKKRAFWTSCAEAKAQPTIHDARERFALPSRFQKRYEVRVKVEVPGGAKLRYAEGRIAPQCAGAPGQPCGHSYPGGGLQYWIRNPKKLGRITLECTKSEPDQETAWEPCKKQGGRDGRPQRG